MVQYVLNRMRSCFFCPDNCFEVAVCQRQLAMYIVAEMSTEVSMLASCMANSNNKLPIGTVMDV